LITAKSKAEILNNLSKRAEKSRKSFHHFFKEFFEVVSTEKLSENWSQKVLCDELQLLGESIRDRKEKPHDLSINISPGTGKSIIASQLFPVWLWLIDPTIIILSGSHNITLATKNSRKSRDVIESEKFYYLFGDEIKLRDDQNTVTHYANQKGGERITTAVSSKPIGVHAHIHIIDDPIDPEGVLSEAVLSKTNRFFPDVLDTRKVNELITPLVLIMQRLHENDPSAYIAKKYPNVKQLVFPVTTDYKVVPSKYKRRYIGGYFDPIRLGKKAIDAKKKKMSSIQFTAQFGQSATAPEGNILKKKMVHVINRADVPVQVFGKESGFFGDMAYTKKKKNDPSGLLEVKLYKDILYIWDFKKFWEEFDEAIEEARSWLIEKDEEKSSFYIENKASGLSIGQHLRTTYKMNTIDYTHPGGDKEALLRFILKYLESGRVVFVKGNYLSDFLKVLLSFPRVSHDEEVDCLIMAVFTCIIEFEGAGREAKAS